MATYMHDGAGRPIYVRGIAAPYEKFSRSLESAGGKREIIRRRAFDAVLQASRRLTCVAYHLDGPGLFASVEAGNLSIWTDDRGLCFEATRIEPTRVNRAIISAIVSGTLRGCSWYGAPNVRTETIAGERVQVIRSFHSLQHISLAENPAYPNTAVWCSHEDVGYLPPALQAVIAHWQDNRPTGRASTRPATSRPAARATSRSAPMTPTSEACPAPIDWTQAEWEEFGFREAAGRRAFARVKTYQASCADSEGAKGQPGRSSAFAGAAGPIPRERFRQEGA